MLRPVCSSSFRAILPRARGFPLAQFSSSSISLADQPNDSLDLDPSYKVLLRDVDISLVKPKNLQQPLHPSRPALRELEAFPIELTEEEARETDIAVREREHEIYEEEEYQAGKREARKSPAASFGSQAIGQVVLPLELQKTIGLMIQGKFSAP